MSLNDRIYWAMFVENQAIQKLGSVTELYRMFEDILKNRGITTTLKKFERLCQDIGLSLRPGPGRPKGTKNSPKSPRSLRVISQD